MQCSQKKREELQRVLGRAVSDSNLRKVVSAVQALSALQTGQVCIEASEDVAEFGADLDFRAPQRFVVDSSLEDVLGGEEIVASSSSTTWTPQTDGGRKFDLSWLRGECDQVVRGNASQLSRDELALAICQVLACDKPGEEVCDCIFFGCRITLTTLSSNFFFFVSFSSKDCR